MEGLTVVDSVNIKDIEGAFYMTDGLCGYSFYLDSNMTFRKIAFSCIGRFTLDSGYWSIQNRNTVVIKSAADTLYFDILKYDNFYFFILPNERDAFVSDLQETTVKYKNAKPFTFHNKTYTVNYIVGYSLNEKYYASEIDDSTNR